MNDYERGFADGVMLCVKFATDVYTAYQKALQPSKPLYIYGNENRLVELKPTDKDKPVKKTLK